MQFLAYLLARFSEPSSYAGLGAVFALFGLHFSDSVTGQAAQCLAAFCALAALFLKERGVIKCLALAVGLAAALGTSLSVTACAPVAGGAQRIDPALTAACTAAMALSADAGPYTVYIEAGCGTAEAIAKLAADPSSAEWVEKLVIDAEASGAVPKPL